jgi:Mandelate racemase / muconate lactonizing enzyme, N-terminal domain
VPGVEQPAGHRSTHCTETEERHVAHASTRGTTTSISAPPATCGNDIIRSIVRISGISTVVVDAGDRDWVFVRAATDEPGLVGWGESSLGWHTRAVCGAVQDLEPLLVGQDPRPVERLWQRMVAARTSAAASSR